ncbi:hypothetical protein CP985_05720 [Malaciobacter mytili LMG 24559]|uniref:DUF3164 domain-containing protein n=1 Tax=Malaciobacter mytili LMG 24559 TaxID=1032238 RepID=A0AAX2AGC7_9BACT|nr:DUF3164 family protein [Malaciobacter mytili]AXH14352.1 DUF3164 domain-containing protein [Malaciobacter mytili LMG 24559]RXK16072.1 hypothetical protein CP985_05720 [Malaciobacter mytili LMG 24559]
MAVIVNGKWQDKEGNFKHPDMVRVDKQIEDELVEGLVESALVLHKQMKDFKIKAFAECYAFVDLLRKEYEMERITSTVGAVTLKSFNGIKEVQIQVAKLITFDQKLTLAKEKIDEYLTHKTENLDSEIQTLITRAFDVKNGKVDAKQIIGLKSYNITHPKWKEAMSMIDEATEIAGTKSYIRFKQRAGLKIDGGMETIVLDLAALPVEESEIQTVKKELVKEKQGDNQ